jgi:hypothetical protein
MRSSLVGPRLEKEARPKPPSLGSAIAATVVGAAQARTAPRRAEPAGRCGEPGGGTRPGGPGQLLAMVGGWGFAPGPGPGSSERYAQAVLRQDFPVGWPRNWQNLTERRHSRSWVEPQLECVSEKRHRERLPPKGRGCLHGARLARSALSQVFDRNQPSLAKKPDGGDMGTARAWPETARPSASTICTSPCRKEKGRLSVRGDARAGGHVLGISDDHCGQNP